MLITETRDSYRAVAPLLERRNSSAPSLIADTAADKLEVASFVLTTTYAEVGAADWLKGITGRSLSAA